MKNGTHNHTEQHHRVKSAVADLKHDSKALLDSTVDHMEEEIVAARQRLAKAISDAADNLKQTTALKVKAADRTIRANPYQSIAIAAGVGILAGFFISRRFKKS